MATRGHNPKRAKRGPELVQRSRAAVLNALDVVEKRGKKISELLADEFEQNPIKFMELAAKFCPKEMDVTTTNQSPKNMSDADLVELIEECRAILGKGSTGTADQDESAEQLH